MLTMRLENIAFHKLFGNLQFSDLNREKGLFFDDISLYLSLLCVSKATLFNLDQTVPKDNAPTFSRFLQFIQGDYIKWAYI